MTSSFSSHILARTHNKFLYFYFATNSCPQTFLVDQNINFEPCVILILFSFYRTRKQTKSVTSSHLNGFLVEFREKIAQMNWNYNPGQNPFATNATARQNEAFSLPPSPSVPGVVLTLCIQVCFNTINTAWGRGEGNSRNRRT